MLQAGEIRPGRHRPTVHRSLRDRRTPIKTSLYVSSPSAPSTEPRWWHRRWLRAARPATGSGCGDAVPSDPLRNCCSSESLGCGFSEVNVGRAAPAYGTVGMYSAVDGRVRSGSTPEAVHLFRTAHLVSVHRSQRPESDPQAETDRNHSQAGSCQDHRHGDIPSSWADRGVAGGPGRVSTRKGRQLLAVLMRSRR